MCQGFENTEKTLTKCVIIAALIVVGAGLSLGLFSEKMEEEIVKPRPVAPKLAPVPDPGAVMDRMAEHWKERVK